MTPLPDSAVASLADEWLPWLESGDGSPRLKLRPWQRLVLQRALSVDSRGRLVFSDVLVSTPRQSGKGWLLYALAVARCHFAEYFNEPQNVLHVANNLKAARRIHRLSWRWAELNALRVRRSAGGEAVEWPDGSAWELTTTSSVWGASSSCAFADEAWDLMPEVVTSAIQPTMAERRETQLWITSTANANATALVPAFRQRAIAGASGLMLAEWSAPPTADPDDPDVWRAATPHWHDGRLKLAEQLRGTSAFRFDILNMWADDASASLRWIPRFETYRSEVLPSVWTTAAVESMPGARLVSLARCGWVDDRLVVSVERVTLPEAARRCVGLTTVVGRSLASDPAWVDAGVAVESRIGSGADVAALFERLITSGVLLHDGDPLLELQVDRCQLRRTSAATVRLVSSADVDAIKAAAWAADCARTALPPPAIY